MAVYVDPLFETARSDKWPYDQASHMMADTIAELYAMAKILKLKTEWIQVTSIVHFDLTKGKRWQAVRNGAIEVDDRFRPTNYKEQVQEMEKHKRG